jgi:cytochrome P450
MTTSSSCPIAHERAGNPGTPVDRGMSLPPGPKGRRLRNFWRRTTDYPGFMRRLNGEYGDIVYYELPFMKCCAVFDADLIREVLVAQQSSFPPWFPGGLNQFLEYGALPLCQDEEQRRRSEFMKAAFSEERMKAYAQIVIEKARELRDRCRSGETVDIVREMERFTWDALVAIIVGRDVEIPRRIGEHLLDFMKLHLVQDMLPLGQQLKRLPLPAFRRGYESNRTLDEAMYRAMYRAREPSHSGEDVISHYVRAGDRERVLPNDRAIRDEMFVLLNAFIDAPAAALVFGVQLIAGDSAVRQRVEREVDEVLDGRQVEPDDFDRLPYLRAVLQETLRLEPPTHVLLPKEASDDRIVGGYRIPKGTLMHVGMHVLHRRPEHWERAGEFRPERWLEEPSPGPPRVPEHAYIPFGEGPHTCRGTDVATRLFVFGLATLSQELRLEPASSAPPKRNSMAVGVSGAWRVNVRERRRAS